MLKIYKLLSILIMGLVVVMPIKSFAETSSDSRIRTYVYGKNDIFKLIASYGYQSSIELDPEENVETISLGNSAAFKINPAGSRIFVRALQLNQVTNMTIVTDKRSYQFELHSTDEENISNMMYVVRFYYPDNVSGLPFSAPSSGQPEMISGAPTMSVNAPAMSGSIYVPRVSIGDMPTPAPINTINPQVPSIDIPQVQMPTALPRVSNMDINNAEQNINTSIPASLKYKYSSVFQR
jgi:type IV secretion system protein VirB9